MQDKHGQPHQVIESFHFCCSDLVDVPLHSRRGAEGRRVSGEARTDCCAASGPQRKPTAPASISPLPSSFCAYGRLLCGARPPWGAREVTSGRSCKESGLAPKLAGNYCWALGE